MNVVWLIGNVVRDAEVKATATGKSVANFRIATNEGSGETKRTDYHSIVCWEALAEEARVHARTGVKAMVQGRVQTRNYESKKPGREGEKVYVTEIVANSVRYLDTVEEDLSDISFGG